MATQTETKHTFEELKEKAALALRVPKLVELVRKASLNTSGINKGKVNLTQVDKESFEYALGETESPKIAEELRKSTHALAMIRRDYEEGFGELVSQMNRQFAQGTEGETSQKRALRQIDFTLPSNSRYPYAIEGIEFTTRVGRFGEVRSLRFASDDARLNLENAWKFCKSTLRNIAESEDFDPHIADPFEKKFSSAEEKNHYRQRKNEGIAEVKKDLARLAEEKFGIRVLNIDSLVQNAEFGPIRPGVEGDTATTVHFSNELREKISQFARDSNTSVGNFLSGIIEVVFQDN